MSALLTLLLLVMLIVVVFLMLKALTTMMITIKPSTIISFENIHTYSLLLHRITIYATACTVFVI